MIRRKHMLGFVLLAGALAMASAAFACTNFMGDFTAEGNLGGSVTSRGVDNGDTFTMTGIVEGSTAASGSNGRVRISLAPGDNPLPDGLYDVNYIKGVAYSRGVSGITFVQTFGNPQGWMEDCMSRSTPPANLNILGDKSVSVVGGTFAEDSKKNYKLPNLPGVPNNASGTESALCISDDSGLNGNQVPVAIV